MNKILYIMGILLIGLGLVGLFMLALPTSAAWEANPRANILVDTLEDELNSDGDCSLREAIASANDNVPVDACASGNEENIDTITFALGGTIMLNSQLDVSDGGPLVIDGESAITVSGGGSVRMFYVNSGGDLTLESLTLVDGYASESGGGGIYNLGTLTVDNSTLSGNRSDAFEGGGGIYNASGTLTVSNSTFSGNTAQHGGGIQNSCCSATIIDSSLSGNNADSGGGINNGCCMMVIKNSILSNNNADSSGGGITSFSRLTIGSSTLSDNGADLVGGGIFIYDGKLDINDSTLSNNSANSGGGIYNDAVITITNSTISGNSAATNGGGIANFAYSTLNMDSSTLLSNSAVDTGGGLYNRGILTITNSILSDNFTGMHGGGIYNVDSGILMLTNSTFSSNSSNDSGGGIYNDNGMITINSSTLSGNGAVSSGGGIYNSNDLLTASNSIIANSPSGSNCAGEPITDGGYNIDSEDSCSFDPANNSMPNTDPLLGPLDDYGGSTLTYALLDGSPAVDSGDALNCPLIDQRRAPRPFDGDGDGTALCDVGSYEVVDLISLYPPFQSTNTVPGVAIVYELELSNFTALTDTYTLTTGSHTWVTLLSEESIGPLSSEASQPFTVSVSVPVTATWYMTDTAIITATSTTSPTQYFASALITTRVYSPSQISIEPHDLTSTQYVNEIVTLPLTISNGFGVPLDFTIEPIEFKPWLSLDPVSGTVNTSESAQVQVTLDAAGLSSDVYTAILDVRSNDPDSPIQYVDVTMNVADHPLILLPLISLHPCLGFFDNFSNPASGWAEVDDEYVRSEYLNGEFRILTKQSGYFYLFLAPTCARESYIVETDARWSGTPGQSYGLIFGVNSDFSRYYLFDVNTDYRMFRLVRRDPYGWAELIPPTYASAIKGGNTPNHLRVTRDGSQIILEANGVLLATRTDSTITGLTYVGIVSSPYSDVPSSDARFDNFSLNSLPSGSRSVLDVYPPISKIPPEGYFVNRAAGELWRIEADEER